MATKKPFWVADAETDPFRFNRVPKPFVWGIFDGSTVTFLETTEQFINFVQGEDIILYAHNGGKFDWHFLFPFFDRWDEEILLINGRLARFKIGLCEFRDSFSILPVPLAKYKKTKIDYGIFEAAEREKPHNKAEIRSYLSDDLIDLHTLISRFEEEFGRNLTLAGASLKAWERTANRKAPRSNRKYYEMFYPHYYGGRVQCFQKGIIDGPVTCIDINSAYPRAMLEPHPIGTNHFSAKGRPGQIQGQMLVTVRAPSCGFFPIRENGMLTFPADKETRTFHVTGWEVLEAERQGLGCDVLSFTLFNECLNFADYILPFYEKRLDAKRRMKTATGEELNELKIVDILSKLGMNSLYGKFGSNPWEYEDVILIPPDEISLYKDYTPKAEGERREEHEISGKLGDWFLGRRDLTESEMRFYNVATSASITGYVRAELLRAFSQVEGLIYCDTDSILCREIGNLPIGDALGEWKHEGTFDRAGISGKKLYVLEGGLDDKGKANKPKLASKGVKLGTKELWAIAEGREIHALPESPSFSMFRDEPRFVHRKIRRT